MPNGSDLTEAQFQRLEAPLRRIDATVERFAAHIGGRVERNYHGQPSRSILLDTQDRITRKLQISPCLLSSKRSGERGDYRYLFSVMAWKDGPTGRLFWSKTTAKLRAIPREQSKLQVILASSWQQVQAVAESEMK